MSDFTGLNISGRIATPRDPDWDEARVAWNLVADQRPEAVALVEGVDDVARVVSFAAENGLRVAEQGTGHGAAPLQPLDSTILIKTERMRGIEIDPTARTARIEAGVPVPWSSRRRSAARRCAPTATGRRACRMRSPRSSASSLHPRSLMCPSRSAACHC